MDNEYFNQASTGNNTPNPEAYQYPPTNQPTAYPEYQQSAYTSPDQPVYGAPYGQYTAQPPAQAPYGEYNQQPPYGGYGQAPYGAYGQTPYQVPTTSQPSGSARVFATLGMVFGIIGMALCWFPILDILTFIMSVLSIPFSAIGMKTHSGKAVAGLVLGIIGTILGIAFLSCYSAAGIY